MKKKALELFLEGVSDFVQPKPDLEQYKTPASIASDILFLAYGFHDIKERDVVDLGCGTGMFSIGAKKLGASSVLGVDKDPVCIKQAIHFAQTNELDIDFQCLDISFLSHRADTVVMNPPFGAQKKNLHGDRLFLEKAMELAPVTYSLHLTHTLDFITGLISSKDKEVTVLQTYQFPLIAQFDFHQKLKDVAPVALLRITDD